MRRLCALLLCLALSFPAALAQEAFEVYSRPVELPGIGTMQYYAQNDPLWENMYYEPNPTKSRRRFRDDSCGPVTAAMAIAKQVDMQNLPALLPHSKGTVKDFAFCSCSVNGEFCDETYRRAKYGTSDPAHTCYSPESGEEFLAWLPVIFASYATGNNDHALQLRLAKESGTKIYLFNALANDYGLVYRGTRDWEIALAALREGASVITTVTVGIFSNSSHYIFLAGADDEYLYIMDADMRSAYTKDKNGCLELLSPGVSRARLENVPRLGFHSYYIISQPQENQGGEAHADSP